MRPLIEENLPEVVGELEHPFIYSRKGLAACECLQRRPVPHCRPETRRAKLATSAATIPQPDERNINLIFPQTR